MYTKCLNCGKKLTDTESMRRGYGPECWGKLVGKGVRDSKDVEAIPGQMTLEDYLKEQEDG